MSSTNRSIGSCGTRPRLTPANSKPLLERDRQAGERVSERERGRGQTGLKHSLSWVFARGHEKKREKSDNTRSQCEVSFALKTKWRLFFLRKVCLLRFSIAPLSGPRKKVACLFFLRTSLVFGIEYPRFPHYVRFGTTYRGKKEHEGQLYIALK